MLKYKNFNEKTKKHQKKDLFKIKSYAKNLKDHDGVYFTDFSLHSNVENSRFGFFFTGEGKSKFYLFEVSSLSEEIRSLAEEKSIMMIKNEAPVTIDNFFELDENFIETLKKRKSLARKICASPIDFGVDIKPGVSVNFRYGPFIKIIIKKNNFQEIDVINVIKRFIENGCKPYYL